MSYILQILAADENGLEYLKTMDVVGVGGAALLAADGRALVEKSINVISRFGSAERGFLLSSHRNYDSDKEWQYLRTDHGASRVFMEPRDGGLFELIVLAGWPHIAKRNCQDGSYATADLFEQHRTLPNAWKYNGRADAQLTLTTGKKFDPAPLKSAIASSHLLRDVLILEMGNNTQELYYFLQKNVHRTKR